MKNVFIVCLVTLSVGHLCAEEKNKSEYPDDIASKINFELINKSKKTIALSLNALKPKGNYYLVSPKTETLFTNPDKIGGIYVKIEPGETFATAIDVNAKTDINISTELKKTTQGTAYPSTIEEYSITIKGKTRYLAYNGANKEGERLYPQTGPLKGIGKFTPSFIMEDRTNTGLLKKNNVDMKDIARHIR